MCGLVQLVLLLSIMFSRFNCVVAYISTSFLFYGFLYHILFMHSSVDGQLHCFQLLAALNLCVLVFVWTYVFISLGYIHRSGMVGSYGNNMFNFLRNYQAV